MCAVAGHRGAAPSAALFAAATGREREQWRERGVSDPRTAPPGANPAAAPGVAHAPIVGVTVAVRTTAERLTETATNRAGRRCLCRRRHRVTAHVPNRRSTRATWHGSRSRLANDEEGVGRSGCAVAPTSILRERLAASRLRSLRSPLRGLDPAVALPIEPAIVGATTEVRSLSGGVEMRHGEGGASPERCLRRAPWRNGAR